MAATQEECQQRQEDEIVALESIFAGLNDGETADEAQRPEEVCVKLVERQPEPALEFYLPITLPRPIRIVVDTYAQGQEVVSTPCPSSQALPPFTKQDKPRSRKVDERVDALSQQSKQRRGGKPKEGTNGHLNASAHAFQPGKGTRAKVKGHSQSRPSSHEPINDSSQEAVEAFATLSLGPSKGDRRDGGERLHDTAETPTSRLQSTRQLPPLALLAPITMRVRLPPNYPAEQPPTIENLTAPWLPSESKSSHAWILQKLQEQYQEMSGMEVLYIWATYLTEGIWMSLLEEPSDINAAPAFLQHASKNDECAEASLRFEEHLSTPESQPLLAAQLLAHSRLCSRTTFDASSFDCAICLETRKGRACTRLTGCGHVFCSDCLAGYLSSLVDDGMHRQAKRCPDPECVTLWSEREKQNLVDQEGNLVPPVKAKAAGVISASGEPGAEDEKGKPVVGLVTREELESILGTTRLARLDQLTVKAKLEADPSVSYCPRAGCQAPVVRLSSDENSGHWERFRECLSCGFTFCAWCSRSWHGPTSCPVSFQCELIRRYLSLPPASSDRLLMEQKFGRKTLETMVRRYEEEQQTQTWLSSYTTPCPTCGIAIEKSYGCNHITCKSCQTHYCYLCGKPISSQNPYGHFNTPGYECYQRLFDGLLGNRDPRVQREREEQQAEDGEGGDGRQGWALVLDENGIPLQLEPEDQEMDLLAWQQLA